MSRRALLSVSDKTGIVEFARALHALRRRAAVHRRHRASCWPTPGLPVTEVAEVHRLSRDAGRPRQDAAPARSTAACWRGATCPTHMAALDAARHRARSTCWSSTSIRSRRPSPRPAARSTTRSRTSTSAARRWCARRRRTGRTSRVLTDPAQYARRARRAEGATAASSEATQLRARRWPRSTASPTTTPRSATTCRRCRRRRRRADAQPSSRRRRNGRFVKVQDLRYGENPHQQRRVLPRPAPGARLAGALRTQLQGKELSLQQHRRRRRGVGVREELRRRRPA